jgi:hypothetical protein
MAHLWLKSNAAPAGWQAHLIEEEVILAPPLLPPEGDGIPAAPPPRLKRFKNSAGADEWLLITPPGVVRVNGVLDRVGLRLLQDKDEVHIRGFHPLYFSTERLPQVETFPGAEHPVHCPRCREVVEPGSAAVCCPGPACRTWYHQRSDRECWTYSDKCSLCGQPTALNVGYRWVPAPEEAA